MTILRPDARALIITFLAALLVACASAPLSSSSDDAEAKTFRPNPGKANLYIFRTGLLGAVGPWNVEIDGRSLADVYTYTFVMREVEPGPHTLARAGWGWRDEFNAEAGRNYFFDYNPAGIRTFNEIPEAEGQKMILKLFRAKTFF